MTNQPTQRLTKAAKTIWLFSKSLFYLEDCNRRSTSRTLILGGGTHYTLLKIQCVATMKTMGSQQCLHYQSFLRSLTVNLIVIFLTHKYLLWCSKMMCIERLRLRNFIEDVHNFQAFRLSEQRHFLCVELKNIFWKYHQKKKRTS